MTPQTKTKTEHPDIFLCDDGKGNRWYQDKNGYFVEPETYQEMLEMMKEEDSGPQT